MLYPNTICKHCFILVWCRLPSDYLAHFFQDKFAKHKMIKGDDNYEKCFLFLRKMWQMFSDIFHMCTDVNGENLKKSDHLFTTDVQNTNWWISVLPVPSLFSPRVLSSPSIFVLRMVLNECTYTYTCAVVVVVVVAVCKLKWARVGIYYIFRFWEEGE